jgi:uroporphyrinogen-III decarboxylase
MSNATSVTSSRERVLAAIRGLPVDRVPVMYWLNPHAACRMMATRYPSNNRVKNVQARFLWGRFASAGGMHGAELWRGLPFLMGEYANGEYALHLGADVALLPLATANAPQKTTVEKGHLRFLDVYGAKRKVGGIYLEVAEPAIQSIEHLREYHFPDFSKERYYAGIRRFRQAHPGACIAVEAFGVQDLFSTQIWSMEPFMLALYDAPEEIKTFQQRMADWTIDTAVRSVRAGADVIYLYDDYGYTGRPLISMKMWQEFTFPHLKRIIAAVHEAGAVVMLHSCGYQMPFLPHYVEAELDILQSFQPKAGNEFEAAFAEYGDRLAFATGIDIQLGERMMPQQLREDILKHYRASRSTGRLLLSTTHMLQYTMPEENVSAILETVREIQRGRHG